MKDRVLDHFGYKLISGHDKNVSGTVALKVENIRNNVVVQTTPLFMLLYVKKQA